MSTLVTTDDISKPSPKVQAVAPAIGDLNAIAKQINECFAQINKAFGHIFLRALEAGELLTKAKDIVGHGKWLPWLKDNCPNLPERTAQEYMWLADHRKEMEEKIKSADFAHLTISQAKRLMFAQPQGGSTSPTSPPTSPTDKADKPPKQIRGNGPPTVETVTALGKDFVADLKYLKKNDQEEAAREIVDDIVGLLKALTCWRSSPHHRCSPLGAEAFTPLQRPFYFHLDFYQQ
jgi:hypothetical protein